MIYFIYILKTQFHVDVHLFNLRRPFDKKLELKLISNTNLSLKCFLKCLQTFFMKKFFVFYFIINSLATFELTLIALIIDFGIELQLK